MGRKRVGWNILVIYSGHILIKTMACQFSIYMVLLLMNIVKLGHVSTP